MENVPAKIDYSSNEVIATLKSTVAKDATDAELAMFMEHCKATGLNPFKREVWFIKTQQGVQIMTGIAGFYQIANKHPQYDGCETEIVEEGSRLVKAVCRVYRKDRSRPTVAEAYWDEYNKNFGNWKIQRRVMLSKCAEAMAHRKAFPQEMNDLYVPEEFEQQKEDFNRDQVLTEENVDPQDHVIEMGRQAGTTWGEFAQAVGLSKLMDLASSDRARAKLSERDLVQLDAFLANPPEDLIEETKEEPQEDLTPAHEFEQDEVPGLA